MNIYNDDEQSPFAIYQTEIGSYAIGDALTNDALFSLCRDQGDSKGTLKFFVSHASASVHETPPLPPSMPSMEYMAPPVLPHKASVNPLRPRRRSRSRNGSLSSTSENLPEVAAGYEADLDYPDRDIKKSTARPSQHLITPPIATITTHQLAPRRHPSNHNRPSSPLIQNPDPASSVPNASDRGWCQRKEDKYLPAIPTPPHPLPPQLPPSPNKASFTSSDDPLILQNSTLHSRTESDADADRVSTLKVAENADSSTMPLRRPDNLSIGKSRLESSRVNANELRPSRRPYDDEDNWEMVPSSLVQRHTDEQERVSPTIWSTVRNPGISRQRLTSPYTSRNRHIINNPPTRAPPTAPSGVQEIRTTTQSRPARLPLSHGVFVTWKGEEGGNRKTTPASVPSYSGRLGKNATKSMDNLKLSPCSRRNLPITRPPPPGAVREYTPNTITYSGVPKSYEPPRPNLIRPLPAQGSSYGTSPDVAKGPSLQYSSRAYSSNHISPSQDPLPRPQSTTEDEDPLSPTTHSYTRPQYGPTLDLGESNPRPVSPHRGYHSPGIPGPRPRPTHHSDRSDRSSDIQSGPETTNSTPHTPNSPHRYDPAHGFELSPPSSLSSTLATSGSRSSDATLKQEDHIHFSNLLDQMVQGIKSHVVPQTQPEPEKLSRQLTPPPQSVGRNLSGLEYDDDDEESDDGGGTWIRRPDPPKTSRPPLKVQIDSAVSQRSADTITSQDTPPASHLPNTTTVVPNEPPTAMARPGSTFIDADSDSWAPRPPPENIYDRLDQFFSKHDLDKPVIEAISGDTSPTAEPAIPPNSVNDKARIKAKKSIRIVAEEHKKRIGRTSMANPAAFANNVSRKRNTKFWGSKLEELTTFRSNSTASLPESPSSGPSKGIYLVLLFLMCLY